MMSNTEKKTYNKKVFINYNIKKNLFFHTCEKVALKTELIKKDKKRLCSWKNSLYAFFSNMQVRFTKNKLFENENLIFNFTLQVFV